MTSSATELLADAHATELRDEAPIARLAARARCRHSAIARTARRVAAAVARLRTTARRGTPTACCTPA